MNQYIMYGGGDVYIRLSVKHGKLEIGKELYKTFTKTYNKKLIIMFFVLYYGENEQIDHVINKEDNLCKRLLVEKK